MDVYNRRRDYWWSCKVENELCRSRPLSIVQATCRQGLANASKVAHTPIGAIRAIECYKVYWRRTRYNFRMLLLNNVNRVIAKVISTLLNLPRSLKIVLSPLLCNWIPHSEAQKVPWCIYFERCVKNIVHRANARCLVDRSLPPVEALRYTWEYPGFLEFGTTTAWGVKIKSGCVSNGAKGITRFCDPIKNHNGSQFPSQRFTSSEKLFILLLMIQRCKPFNGREDSKVSNARASPRRNEMPRSSLQRSKLLWNRKYNTSQYTLNIVNGWLYRVRLCVNRPFPCRVGARHGRDRAVHSGKCTGWLYLGDGQSES